MVTHHPFPCSRPQISVFINSLNYQEPDSTCCCAEWPIVGFLLVWVQGGLEGERDLHLAL